MLYFPVSIAQSKDDNFIMSSILDIDLDYFNLIDKPAQKLSRLLEWANCPILFVIENHHESLRLWKDYFKKEQSDEPKYLLHVDEHHDMMDEKSKPNIANFIYHAMKTWPDVHVHWLVDTPIDSPAMWLSNEAWKSVSNRFTSSSYRPRKWPKPQMVSVCTSPEFVESKLLADLIDIIRNWSISSNSSIKRKFPYSTKRE